MNFDFRGGYAAVTTTIITLTVMITIISGFSFFTLQEVETNRLFTRSLHARAVAESGIEDGVYRVVEGKQITSGETIGVGNGTATIILTSSSTQRIIRSEGDEQSARRNLEARLDISTASANFYYGVQIGDGGLQMGNNARINGNVYSNGTIFGQNGATIMGDAIVAGGLPPAPEVQWVSSDADHDFATIPGNRDIAQSFTAASSGPIPKVSVYLAKTGNPGSDVTVHITVDNAGKPSSSSIASATFSPASVGTTPSWIDVSFASAPNVLAGFKYWIVLDYNSNSGTNYWRWRKDSTDGYTGNTGRFTSNWTSGSPVWTDVGGDLAFKVWIGGTSTRIEGLIIGDATSGAGRANVFVDTTIRDTACPNAYCIVENPAHADLPLSDGVIQDWKNEAAAGGVCGPPTCDASGNLTVSGTTTMGPKKITGNMVVTNGSTLIVNGTLWVVGNITLDNNCTVQLSSGYGSLSGVVLTDNKIVVSNNCTFQGSGSPESYFMLLSDKNSPSEEIINVDNNSLGVIYYAGKGRIKFSNLATAKEATAYGMNMDNNATITYESGLADVLFTSGPSGGYTIVHWKEVE